MRLQRNNDETPADLAATVKRLDTQRPEATELELDRVKQRVLTSARRAPTTGGFMRTRMALMSILVAGVLMSTTGGALALSGITGSQSAGDAVYPTNPTVNGDESSGGGGGGGTLGDEATSGTPQEVLQQAAQTESNASGDLPFTGYAAIPLLLIGVALLATGLIMRRRAESPRLS
jgi:hypothetical protein